MKSGLFFTNLVLVILMTSGVSCCQTIDSNDKEVQKLYKEYAQQSLKGNDWISFDVCFDELYNGKLDPSYTYHFSYCLKPDKACLIMMNSDSSCVWKIMSQSLLMINSTNQELAKFVNGYERHQNHYLTYRLFVQQHIEYMPFYGQILPNMLQPEQLLMTKVNDTIVSGKSIKEFVGYTRECYLSNRKGEMEPLQYECHTWIDPKNYCIDSVVSFNVTDNFFKTKKKYTILNICYDDKSTYYDSLFNFENVQYNSYSRHDDNFVPFSMTSSRNTTINDTILDFPLRDLSGNISTIREKKGWVLLDFWCFECPSCINSIREMGHEKDSLGRRLLEFEDIEIVSINYKSDNMELMSKVAKKTNSTDIISSAKGIGKYINIPTLGYFYLLSPNKEIVHQTDHLGDYREIIKAKDEYVRYQNSNIKTSSK